MATKFYMDGVLDERERVLKILDEFFYVKKSQVKSHVEQFGKPGNRDIDPREKSMLLMLPEGYHKKLKELFASEKKGDGGSQ